MAAETETGRAVVEALDALQRLRGWSDEELARRADLGSRMGVHNRRNGHVRITVDDLDRLAKALEVPAGVIIQGADAAVRWVTENGTVVPMDPSRRRARGVGIGGSRKLGASVTSRKLRAA